jgi:hypothetical protein
MASTAASASPSAADLAALGAASSASSYLEGAKARKKKKKNPQAPPSAANSTSPLSTNPPIKSKSVRKKKPVSKPPGSTRQAMFHDARQARSNLHYHRSLVTGMAVDPLWLYRVEDVLPALTEPNAMVSKTSVLPEQVHVIESSMRHAGLQKSDVTPQAIACLLEQARRYALELLTDAQDYGHAAHSSQEITVADLLLATEMRVDHPVEISLQLPRLNVAAARTNAAPLPSLPSQCFSGLILPPQDCQVTSRSFDLIHAGQVARKMVQETPKYHVKSNAQVPGSDTAVAGVGVASLYGASRGRQIPIKLKGSSTTPGVSSTLDVSDRKT